MTKEEHLLVCLAEECAEIQKEVSKALRFGLENSHPKYPGTPRERIEYEMNDLLGVIEFLAENGLHFAQYPNRIEAKKLKLQKYIQYAEEKETIKKE